MDSKKTKIRILVTGAAGFIGFHVVKRLLRDSDVEVTGIDNLNDYYDTDLKLNRLHACGIEIKDISEAAIASTIYPQYTFYKIDIAETQQMDDLFTAGGFDYVIHLAAQGGVRYSIENPMAYTQSNLVGFTNILECCRHHHIKHLIYASSSSVYGSANKIPYNEEDNVDYPVSFYAATKKSNELMAHVYSHLYQLPTTGLRFFTVYGPWGRPDMAPMLFAQAISEDKPIELFNNGEMLRDFTFVDDIVEGVYRVISLLPDQNDIHPYYRIFNVGNSRPVNLSEFVSAMEKQWGKKAKTELRPMQPGDVKDTFADTALLEKYTGYKPSTTLDEGIKKFIDWYKDYYKIG